MLRVGMKKHGEDYPLNATTSRSWHSYRSSKPSSVGIQPWVVAA